jgi:hypothetical protein
MKERRHRHHHHQNHYGCSEGSWEQLRRAAAAAVVAAAQSGKAVMQQGRCSCRGARHGVQASNEEQQKLLARTHARTHAHINTRVCARVHTHAHRGPLVNLLRCMPSDKQQEFNHRKLQDQRVCIARATHPTAQTMFLPEARLQTQCDKQHQRGEILSGSRGASTPTARPWQ